MVDHRVRTRMVRRAVRASTHGTQKACRQRGLAVAAIFKTERSAVIASVVAIAATAVAAIVALAVTGRSDAISSVLSVVAPVEGTLLILLRVSDNADATSEIAQNVKPEALHEVTAHAVSQVLDEKATVVAEDKEQ